jgi:hypothetical protein
MAATGQFPTSLDIEFITGPLAESPQASRYAANWLSTEPPGAVTIGCYFVSTTACGPHCRDQPPRSHLPTALRTTSRSWSQLDESGRAEITVERIGRMWTCIYACYDANMPKSIQIRDVDDEVYAALVRRAAEERISVPELLRREATRLAARPSVTQWMARLGRRPSSISTAEVLATLDEWRGPWPDAGR